MVYKDKSKRPKPPSGKKTPEEIEYHRHRNELEKIRLGSARSNLQYGKKDSPAVREAFLERLRRGDTPTIAANTVGICGTTARSWRNKDPEFAEQWLEALQDGTDALEQEAIRRGKEGVDRPVFQGGECVGFVREYSDTLLIKALEARDPARFSNKHNMAVNAKVEVIDHGAIQALEHAFLGLIAQRERAAESAAIESEPAAEGSTGEDVVVPPKDGSVP